MATVRHGAHATKTRPIAIIDIGSNSVRLVAYDNLDRAPIPSFNEKSLCALGNGVITTGKLSKSGVEKALIALKRFRALVEIMGIEDVRVIATAAGAGRLERARLPRRGARGAGRSRDRAALRSARG